jgi:hypothetical protein
MPNGIRGLNAAHLSTQFIGFGSRSASKGTNNPGGGLVRAFDDYLFLGGKGCTGGQYSKWQIRKADD